MCKSHEQKKRSRNKSKKIMKQKACGILIQIFIFLHYYFDKLIDNLFSIFWDSKRKNLPNLKCDKFITLSAVDIAEKIRNKQLTSTEVVQAYINRIKQVNPVINACTDYCYDSALKTAEEIDLKIKNGEYKKEDFDKKPFLGVPFSSKDSTALKGHRHTFGLLCRKDEIADEHAEIVRLSIEAGGIPLVLTNVPEVNKWQETHNYLFGITKNPYNTTRTVGGSSGGEGALVSSCGTTWGLGTDIGGSTRMPAFFCGLFGHKPSSGIINMRGCTLRTGNEGKTMCVAGPITRFAKDLAPLTKVLAAKKANLLKLDKPVDISKIKVFYTESSNELLCSSISSDLKLALRKAVESLQNSCETKSVDISGTEYSTKLWRYWMTQEKANFPSLLCNGKGEANGIVEFLKKLLGQSDLSLASILSLLDGLLKPENEEWAKKLTDDIRKQVVEILGQDGVLIYPSGSFPAQYHFAAFLRPYNFSYWGIFNVLHLPVTQVPLGLNADGLPLGVQVVAAPYNDHLCFAVAKQLETHFGGWVPPFKIE